MMRWIIGVAVLITGVTAWAESERYLRYEQFIRDVEAGLIESVRVDRFSRIVGEMRVEDGTQSFHTYSDTGSANDPLLIRLLNEHDVAVTIQSERDDLMFPGLMSLFGLMYIVIPLTLVVLAFLINHKLNRVLANQHRVLSAPGSAFYDDPLQPGP